jgi:hypothetical protein
MMMQPQVPLLNFRMVLDAMAIHEDALTYAVGADVMPAPKAPVLNRIYALPANVARWIVAAWLQSVPPSE